MTKPSACPYGAGDLRVSEKDDLKAAQQGIDLLEQWFRKIGAPVNFSEAGMPTDDLEKLADDALVSAEMWGLSDFWTKQRAMDMLKLCI